MRFCWRNLIRPCNIRFRQTNLSWAHHDYLRFPSSLTATTGSLGRPVADLSGPAMWRWQLRVNEIYIISIPDDAMVEQSAQGFFYKYVMRTQPIVRWFELRANGTADLRLEYSPETGFSAYGKENNQWVSKINQDLSKKTMPSESSSSTGESEDKSVGATKLPREYGAILVAHKQGGDKFGGFTPEALADELAKFPPVFSKISFNVCKAVGSPSRDEAHHQGWEFEQINPTSAEIDMYKKANKDRILKELADANNGKRVNSIPKKRWDQEEALKTKTQFKSTTEKGVIYALRDFNMIVRFLHKYVRAKDTTEKVLVAGYDIGLTAAHPEKKKPRPPGSFENQFIGRRLTDNGTFISDLPDYLDHKQCFIAERGKQGIVQRVELSGWTDRV